jgi:uncharacterized repeat protein (TIGR03803 family)
MIRRFPVNRTDTRRNLNTSLAIAAFLCLAVVALASARAQSFSVLHTFAGTPDGASPNNADVLDVDGNLLGTTSAGGIYGFGTIFKIDGAGAETVIYSFTGGRDGAGPNSGLVRDKNGDFYGTTATGGNLSCSYLGSVGCGVTYRLDSKGHVTVLHRFTGATDGADPWGLIIDSAGNLYGTAAWGGDLNDCPGIGCGVVYEMNTSGTETVLYSFTGGADEGAPQGLLTRDAMGDLYGVTNLGTGTVFKLSPGGNEKVLYTFSFGSDGGCPNGPLLLDAKGDLYGTAVCGGDLTCVDGIQGTGCGVIFEVTVGGNEPVLHTFEGPDGANPLYGLTADSQGNGFGTTSAGGNTGCSSQYQVGCGVVFEITSKGLEKVLHTFTGASDGGVPLSGVIRDSSGNLYGNTYQGGDLSCSPPYGCGTVFKLVP